MLKRIIPRQIKSIIKPILRKIETNIYAGKKFKCPVCNFESKDFDFIGFDIPILKEKEVVGSGRRKARCYNCDSNDRERLIYTYLKYEENILNKDKEWKLLSPMQTPRYLHACTSFPAETGETEVLVTGGYNKDYLNSTEIYNINSNT